MKTIILTLALVLGFSVASFAQTNMLGQSMTTTTYGSTGSVTVKTTYGSTGSSYGSTGSSYVTSSKSYGSTGNGFKSRFNLIEKVTNRKAARKAARKVVRSVKTLRTPLFGVDSVTAHLIEDHKVPAEYVRSLTFRERQDLHDSLHLE